jgi:3'-phosphoadenosine 5'-phosphosulfate sulfotransferase (PAPS reductase)/FAD synthetase
MIYNSMGIKLSRVLVWFSAGVTSAIAAKIALDTYGGALPVHLVNCDTGSEDEDNGRFMADVAAWLSVPLEIVANQKYADTFEVYRSSGFIKNQYGAKCTLELKKLPRRQYENLQTDLQVFGYDANEQARAMRFVENNPEVTAWFPLLDAGVTKAQARQMLVQAGIAEPRTYGEGFKNANCLARGCVKGGMGYWNHIRRVRPEVFANMARLEREIGHAICSTEERGANGERVKVPVYLDELPPHWGSYDSEPAFQCGLFCGEY